MQILNGTCLDGGRGDSMRLHPKENESISRTELKRTIECFLITFGTTLLL
jgi:hypothetical protein